MLIGRLSSQIIRYGLVSVINTAFSYGMYALTIFLGVGYQGASLVSLVLGILFSFMTQGTMVFKGVSKMAFIRYLMVWCMLYFANVWLIGFLQQLSINLYVAGAIATMPIALMGYLFMKFFVFRKDKISPVDFCNLHG